MLPLREHLLVLLVDVADLAQERGIPAASDAVSSRRAGLQDCAAWRHLNGGNAACVSHHEPFTMFAAKHAGVVRKPGKNVLDDFVLIVSVGLVVCDICVVTAGKSNT
jgi:hypothetical protein